MSTRIDHVFVGGLSALAPEGQPTGMFKASVAGPVCLGPEGLEGDIQADRRVHGGPEKAVHHYAAEHYPLLAAHFPVAAAEFIPGSLGENLSTTGWTEQAVCIGDVFRIGTCRVQVSQPRSPCWKINHRFGESSLSRFVAEHGIAGWYYRVLASGTIQAGDEFELIERNATPVSLHRLWHSSLAHRPEPDELSALAATPGLAALWVRKLNERLEWLRANPELPR